MYPAVKQVQDVFRTLTFYSRLIDYCLSSKSLRLTKAVHGQLVKVGFNRHTFLGNRCLQLYTRFQCVGDILKAFSDISGKNNFSWNICLKGLLNCGHSEMAQSVFQNMPERDVVSWNSMISWHAKCGHSRVVREQFKDMLYTGLRPSAYTYSILVSVVSNVLHGKELHGCLITSGLIRSSMVLGNSLIDMYSKLGMIDYAFGVFWMMEQLDVISWNSLIVGCCRCGYRELALSLFASMRSKGCSPDEFTLSSVFTCCTELRNLEMGKQIFALCIKVGFVYNSIMASAVIDLFSKCNRLEYSVQFFKEVKTWDSEVCSSMISCYAWHSFGDIALQLFVLMLKNGIRPTEFAFSSVLSSLSDIPVEQGTQLHCLVTKTGFGMDAIVGSSLVHMYAQYGFMDCAMKIFMSLALRDLISWNTMITGLVYNGRCLEAIRIFNELLSVGLPPDQISLAGVLSACNYGGFVDEGWSIFSKMEELYGIEPCCEHYASIVDLLCQAGRISEVVGIIQKMPYHPSTTIWESLLRACVVHGYVKLAEVVSGRLMELEPHLSLPYLVMARTYEMSGQWEDVIRMKDILKKKKVNNISGCSLIGIQSRVHTFSGENLHQNSGNEIYPILRLLSWEEGQNLFPLVNSEALDVD